MRKIYLIIILLFTGLFIVGCSKASKVAKLTALAKQIEVVCANEKTTSVEKISLDDFEFKNVPIKHFLKKSINKALSFNRVSIKYQLTTISGNIKSEEITKIFTNFYISEVEKELLNEELNRVKLILKKAGQVINPSEISIKDKAAINSAIAFDNYDKKKYSIEYKTTINEEFKQIIVNIKLKYKNTLITDERTLQLGGFAE